MAATWGFFFNALSELTLAEVHLEEWRFNNGTMVADAQGLGLYGWWWNCLVVLLASFDSLDNSAICFEMSWGDHVFFVAGTCCTQNLGDKCLKDEGLDCWRCWDDSQDASMCTSRMKAFRRFKWPFREVRSRWWMKASWWARRHVMFKDVFFLSPDGSVFCYILLSIDAHFIFNVGWNVFEALRVLVFFFQRGIVAASGFFWGHRIPLSSKLPSDVEVLSKNCSQKALNQLSFE